MDDIVEHVKNQKNIIFAELDSIRKSNNDDQNIKKIKLDELYLKVEECQKYVHQYLSNMIAYDIRTCNNLIKEMENEIKNERSALTSNKSFKFSFNPSKNLNKSKSNNENNTVEKPVNVNLVDGDLSQNCDGFKNLSNQELTMERTKTENKDIVIDTMTDCTIRIYGLPKSVRLINLKNCSIFSGPIQSSAYIEKCFQCKFHMIAQQIRIHETNECDFYLHVGSRTIIEDSTKLQFGIYDWSYDELNEDFKKSGINPEQNNWKQIDDFNCLSSTSKNWSLIT